jgi:predicted nucleic acid-binding protein
VARIAVLDANVLWPQHLRDFLIRAAIFDMYRAAWTDRILEEMRNSLIRERRVGPQQIERTVRLMRENGAHFMVTGYEDLIPVMTNDEKDRHVLAAAVRAGADTIVTANAKHFPLASREKYGIELHKPDAFLGELWETDAGTMAGVIVSMAAGLKKPPMTSEDLIENLAKQAPNFAKRVLDSAELSAAIVRARDGIPTPSYRLM